MSWTQMQYSHKNTQQAIHQIHHPDHPPTNQPSPQMKACLLCPNPALHIQGNIAHHHIQCSNTQIQIIRNTANQQLNTTITQFNQLINNIAQTTQTNHNEISDIIRQHVQQSSHNNTPLHNHYPMIHQMGLMPVTPPQKSRIQQNQASLIYMGILPKHIHEQVTQTIMLIINKQQQIRTSQQIINHLSIQAKTNHHISQILTDFHNAKAKANPTPRKLLIHTWRKLNQQLLEKAQAIQQVTNAVLKQKEKQICQHIKNTHTIMKQSRPRKKQKTINKHQQQPSTQTTLAKYGYTFNTTLTQSQKSNITICTHHICQHKHKKHKANLFVFE
jgi:hypothetical protein